MRADMNRHGSAAQPTPKKQKKEAASKPKTAKQNWTAYVAEHGIGDKNLPEEPEDGINQTDSKTHYLLTPGDLACLSHFPKPNPKYGNMTKLFSKEDVQKLGYRKAAVVAGIVEDKDLEGFLEKGKQLLEETLKEREPQSSAEEKNGEPATKDETPEKA